MRAREFHALLSRATGATIGEIDQRTRFLRATGNVKSGARGLAAPDIETTEAACMLLAMVSRRASDAGEIFLKTANLTAIPIGGGKLLDSAKLCTVIASIFSIPADWSDAMEVRRIEIEENGEYAWLRLAGMDILFSNDQTIREWVSEFPDAYENQYGASARRHFVVGGGLLYQAALEVAGADEPAKYAEA